MIRIRLWDGAASPTVGIPSIVFSGCHHAANQGSAELDGSEFVDYFDRSNAVISTGLILVSKIAKFSLNSIDV
jgi:hypothetical protein